MTSKPISAGVVVLFNSPTQGYQILSLRNPGFWDLPKGEIDQGEDPFATAKRELYEETKIKDSDLTWLTKEFLDVSYKLSTGKVKTVRFYLAESRHNKVTISWEHKSSAWFSFVSAKETLPERFHPLIKWAESFVG